MATDTFKGYRSPAVNAHLNCACVMLHRRGLLVVNHGYSGAVINGAVPFLNGLGANILHDLVRVLMHVAGRNLR